jgi:hypothetical protein
MSKRRDLYQIISENLTKNKIGTPEKVEEISTEIYYDYCDEYYPKKEIKAKQYNDMDF